MNKTQLRRLSAILLTVLLLAAFFACSSSSDEAQTPEPETDEIGTPGTEPENGQQPGRIALNVPADGTYTVSLHRDVTVDSDGREYVSATQILYAELDNETVEALNVGDTVTLPNAYQFVVEIMQRSEADGVRSILFNEGLERCVFIPETNTWRFLWPSEAPYTYDGEVYVVPMAVDVRLSDEYTPVSMGESVYGTPYDEADETIDLLDSVQDFFSYHYYLENEQVTMKVKDGEVASIVFDYHE